MRYIKYIFLLLPFSFFISCKKEKVNGESLRTFQSSINNMVSPLTTIKQIKFNEALYIIKKFGTNTEEDIEQIKSIAKLLNGKNAQEILNLADSIAQDQGIEWSSTSPPSLGNMNIFADNKVNEIDPNDIQASRISITINPYGVDSITYPKALIITPYLLNEQGNKIEFNNAALEAILEVYSGSLRISILKNLMVNNNFKGFYLKLKSLPLEKIVDNSIDIKVKIKTAKKILEITKKNIPLNTNALSTKVTTELKEKENLASDAIIGNINRTKEPISTDDKMIVTSPTEMLKPLGDPNISVSKFIENISTKNLKLAYEMCNNPNWRSYDLFSNSDFIFNSVKVINIKSINTINKTVDKATVSAKYTIADNNGKNKDLNVIFTLKASADGWKITNYEINSEK